MNKARQPNKKIDRHYCLQLHTLCLSRKKKETRTQRRRIGCVDLSTYTTKEEESIMFRALTTWVCGVRCDWMLIIMEVSIIAEDFSAISRDCRVKLICFQGHQVWCRGMCSYAARCGATCRCCPGYNGTQGVKCCD